MSDDTTFVVGKVLQQRDPDTIDGTFDALSCAGTAWRCGHGQPDGPLWSEQRRVCFPPFTAVLLDRRRFVEVGGLEERFESYLEDVEFGLRCASKGYTGRYEPEALCYHAGSATLGRWHPRTVRQIARNQLLIVARHYTKSMILRFGWRIAVGQLLWGLIAVRHGAGGPWLKGKLQAFSQFKAMRSEGSDSVGDLLEASEADIRTLGAAGRDTYWRWYFALT